MRLSTRREAILNKTTLDPDLGEKISLQFGNDWVDRFIAKKILVRDLEAAVEQHDNSTGA